MRKGFSYLIKSIPYYVLFIGAALLMHLYFLQSGAYFNETCCDSLKQVSYFYPFLERVIEQGSFFWSFNYGLGGDVFGQFLYYYSASPFFWLTILIYNIDSLRDIFELRLLISVAKLSLAMIFSFHLFRYLNRSTGASIIGSIIYGGSVYFTFYSLRYDFMVDGMVWLPLLILGYERFLSTNKKGLLIFAVFIVVCSNFYLAFINSIYLGLYAIFKYFILNEKYNVKRFFSHMLRFVYIYTIGFLLAGFTFFPAVYNFLKVDRFYYEHEIPLLFSKQFYYSLPYELFFLSESFRLNSSFSVIMLLLFVCGLFIRKKSVRIVMLFSLFILLMFVTPFSYSMFNGFSSIQFRWLYLLVFMMAYAVTFVYDELPTRPGIREFFLFCGVIAALVITVMFKDEVTGIYASKGDLLILRIAVVSSVFLLIRNFIPKAILSVTLIILLLINNTFINNTMFNTFLADGKELREDQEKVLTSSNFGIPSEKELFNRIQQNDDRFSRIIWNELREQNAPLLYGYNGVSSYNSLLAGDVHRFVKSDFNTLQENAPSMFNNVDNRIYIESALGVKYYVTSEGDIFKPTGYSLVDRSEGFNVYKNDFALPLGFMYTEVYGQDAFHELEYAEKDEMLLQAAVIEDNAMGFPEFNRSNLGAETFDIELNSLILENASLTGNTLSVNPYVKVIVPNVLPNEEGETLVELAIKRKDREPFIIDVNQKTFHYLGDNNIYNYPKERIVFNLGNVNPDEVIDIGLTPGDYELTSVKLHFNSYIVFEELVEKRRKMSLRNVTVENGSVSGEINAVEKGILYLSIPYSTGWKVKVDGVNTKTLRVNNAFIGVPLETGTHKIDMQFISPMFIPGLVISMAAFVWLLFTRMRKTKSGS